MTDRPSQTGCLISNSREKVIEAVPVKSATLVFQPNKVIFECPFCGRTLIRTTYEKVRKLLDDTGPPRGKICDKCGETVKLKLNEKAREIIESKAWRG